MEQRPSITQQFEQTLSDQDTMQRTSMCITVAFNNVVDLSESLTRKQMEALRRIL
jgi:hypothetical protein